MSDTTGWETDAVWGMEKEIGSHRFHIIEAGGKFILRIPGQSIATRPTLRECQILAHDTARLWAGDSE